MTYSDHSAAEGHTALSATNGKRAAGQGLTRVFLLAGITLYREGLARFLDDHDEIELVGATGDLADAIAQIAGVAPEVVLLDRLLGDGIGLVRRILAVRPRPHVVALAVTEIESDILPYAYAGVSGYVMHDDSLDALARKTLAVARGEVLCSPRTAATLLRGLERKQHRADIASNPGLTKRELEILDLLHDGLSNREIADRLVIELPTVKNHVHHIYEKLGVRGRAAACAWLRSQQAPADAVARLWPSLAQGSLNGHT